MKIVILKGIKFNTTSKIKSGIRKIAKNRCINTLIKLKPPECVLQIIKIKCPSSYLLS